MSLSDLTSRNAILQAMAEFDQAGQDAFLSKYGFGRSRHYFLKSDDRLYDSKAIVGAAHGYQFPQIGALRSGEFSGGARTVQAKLEELGFVVIALPAS